MSNNKSTQNSSLDKWLPTMIVAIIAVIGSIIVALINRSTATLPINATQTAETLHTSIAMTAREILPNSTDTPATTFIPAHTFTPVPSPTLTVENRLIQLMDNYYTCINAAKPDNDSDYENCWNLLSDRPGELQSHLNKEDTKLFWQKYRTAYSLYYCSKGIEKLVDAKYYLYDLQNLSVPMGPLFLEYSFALDANGWRIKGADTILGTGSYCENEPRIEKLTIVP